jgi:hypothetical protein
MTTRNYVKLSELADETIVFQEDEHVVTARELRQSILNGDEDREAGWLVGIPTAWTPDAKSMFEDYIENESVEMYEDADEEMWDQINPLVERIQSILDSVKVPYYESGESIEIDDISHSACTYCGTIEGLTIESDGTCICPDCLSECEPNEDGYQ